MCHYNSSRVLWQTVKLTLLKIGVASVLQAEEISVVARVKVVERSMGEYGISLCECATLIGQCVVEVTILKFGVAGQHNTNGVVSFGEYFEKLVVLEQIQHRKVTQDKLK